jgi:hypothetical protein
MRNKHMLIGVVGIVVGVLLSSVVFVLAGNPDSPAAPGATNSFTLNDIYNRLTTGADGAPSTFTEPGVAPGTGTMHTLNEIYDLIGLRAPVPKTWQTKCYTNTANSEVNCPAAGWPGQDGNHQKGVAWPDPRFTISGGTVTDNLTGLIWLKDANCIVTEYPGYDADGKVTWQQALQFVAGINDGTYPNCGAGHTDWRLPNVRELHSLIHYGVSNPALPDIAGTAQLPCTSPPNCGDGDPFYNVQSDFYWSSTTFAGNTSRAWHVGMRGGGVDVTNLKGNALYVWPVRGGQ